MMSQEIQVTAAEGKRAKLRNFSRTASAGLQTTFPFTVDQHLSSPVFVMPDYKKKRTVDDELVQELRAKFLAEMEESDPDLYHPEDIARVKENDWYITRYLLHQHKNVDNALKMMKESLKWRKEFEANTVSRADVPVEFFNVRATFEYGKDKHGHPIVMVRTKTHVKDEKLRRVQQLYTIYWVERAVRASDWGVVSVLFDCTDAGLSNVDLDMIRFILNMFKKYYPWALAYFIVYNMPWYLSGIWKVIKPWIPERYLSKVSFVDQTTILDLVNSDQLPIALGGTCTKIYEPKEGSEVPNEEEDDIQPPEVTQC